MLPVARAARAGWQRIVKVSFNLSTAALKRFYENVGIRKTSEGYAVALDGRVVKTPLRNELLVPSESLAVAIAAEWDAQWEKIQPSGMHLTSLCMTAIDKLSETTRESQVSDILPFLQTDCSCFRVSEPDDFVKLQTDTWDPIIDWFQNKFDVKLKVSTGLLEAFQEIETMDRVRDVLMTYDPHVLLGVHSAVSSLSSLVIAMGLVGNFISVEKAVQAANLESEYQTKKWGTVEWSHSMSYTDTTARVAASMLFIKHYKS
ncbi:ATP synthase mitochondrial F1 complex assembly factor 2-like isoform X1 [Corticium candelabrum]|uniref:ATP synthase mitochondrial F1 complex assembly factor 2-like isoform X1 n=1 Tax=Corticium candelabrum TaxID=121492 RepID=UPI002E2EB30C|nr:ATP synthase mitochondrial F1 complex assembly factor 2-like isoform X1 [Corticium candelabrum]